MMVHKYLQKVADYVKMGFTISNEESNQKMSSVPTLPLPHQRRISTLAAPGLMTLIDTALFQVNEGQIMSTICSANATLCAVLELKRQASLLLYAIQQAQGPSVFLSTQSSTQSSRNKQNHHGKNQKNQHSPAKTWSMHVERLSSLEQYAKHALECADAAINRIVTDHLSASANLTLDTNEENISSQDLNARPLPPKSNDDKPSSNKEPPKKSPSQQQDAKEMLILQTILKSATPTQTQLQLMARSPSLAQALRRKSSWEASTLYCPDYVWADSVHTNCTRLLRSLQKGGLAQFQAIHEWQNDNQAFRRHDNHDQQFDSDCILAYNNVQNLVNIDLPLRLQQFRKALEGDAVVLKRLYLVKCEVRAPFRCFWEGHMKVQKLPDLDLVKRYLDNHKTSDSSNTGNLKGLSEENNFMTEEGGSRKEAEVRIQECIKSKPLLKALEMEMDRERIEMDISKALLPFCQLSKVLGVESGSTNKNLFWVVPIPGVLEENDRKMVFEVLRRLRSISWSPNNAAVGGSLSGNHPVGIRSLLMDLQGIPRNHSSLVYELDPFKPKRRNEKNDLDGRVATFSYYLQLIYDLALKTKTGGNGSGFYTDKRDSNFGSVAKECSNFDSKKFQSNIKEWFTLSKQQRDLSLGIDESISVDSEQKQQDENDFTSSPNKGFKELAEELRKSEIEVTIGMASKLQLEMVRDRIEGIEKDRMKRFEVLQDMLQDVCFREMDFHLKLTAPEKNLALELPELKSARGGVFGPALEIAGEVLSSG